MSGRLTFGYDVPDWIRQYVSEQVVRFGVDRWTIRVEMADKPDNDPQLNGSCLAEYRHNGAFIELKRQPFIGQTERDTRRTIVHELLHVATAAIDTAVEDRIIELVPEPLRDHAKQLYLDGLEVAVHALANALTANEEVADGPHA